MLPVCSYAAWKGDCARLEVTSVNIREEEVDRPEATARCGGGVTVTTKVLIKFHRLFVSLWSLVVLLLSHLLCIGVVSNEDTTHFFFR